MVSAAGLVVDESGVARCGWTTSADDQVTCDQVTCHDDELGVAVHGGADVERLMADTAIVGNRLRTRAAGAPTTTHSAMQACGLVNDQLIGCQRSGG